MDGHILEKLNKNAVVYIKDENGEFTPLGTSTMVSLTQEAGSLPTISLELLCAPVPNPEKPKTVCTFSPEGLTMSMDTSIVDDLISMFPPPKCGKNLFENTTGIGGLHSYGAIPYEPYDYISLEDRLKEEEEGNDMKLLDLYKEKSLKAIEELYEKALDAEAEKDVMMKDVQDFYDNMDRELETLKEKYSQENAEMFGGYLGIDTSFELNIDDVHLVNKKVEWLKAEKDKAIAKLLDAIEEVNAHLEVIDYASTEDEYRAKMQLLMNYDIIDDDWHVKPLKPTIDEKSFKDDEESSVKVEEVPTKTEKKRGRPKKDKIDFA